MKYKGCPISGIYAIVNNKDGRAYVGQSTNLYKRLNDHLHSYESEIDRDIHYYGEENFTFTVLEICDEYLLDEREIYYIELLESYKYGYNKATGGKYGKCNIGESNSNAKLTEKEVYAIREAYNNHERKHSVYENYKDKITINSFDPVWEGKTWTEVHMDVYTKENLDYYMKGTCLGENGKCAIFTDEEVLELRKRYVNESAKEIYNSLDKKCNFQTLQQLLWGRHYSHLPIYDKKNKIWINNNNNN